MILCEVRVDQGAITQAFQIHCPLTALQDSAVDVVLTSYSWMKVIRQGYKMK